MILQSKENVWKDERLLITSIWRDVLLCRENMVKLNVGTQHAKY